MSFVAAAAAVAKVANFADIFRDVTVLSVLVDWRDLTATAVVAISVWIV